MIFLGKIVDTQMLKNLTLLLIHKIRLSSHVTHHFPILILKKGYLAIALHHFIQVRFLIIDFFEADKKLIPQCAIAHEEINFDVER